MTVKIESMLPYLKEIEMHKRVLMAQNNEKARALEDLLKPHMKGRSPLSTILSMKKEDFPDNPSAKDSIYMRMFNSPDINSPYKQIFGKNDISETEISYSDIPEEDREQLKQTIENKVGSNPHDIEYDKSKDEWSLGNVLAQAGRGAASLVTAPVDAFRNFDAWRNEKGLPLYVPSDYLGGYSPPIEIPADKEQGFASLGESWDEATHRNIKNLLSKGGINTGTPQKKWQRYVDNIANWGGALLGGGGLIKGVGKLGNASWKGAKSLIKNIPKNIKAKDIATKLGTVGNDTLKKLTLGSILGGGEQYLHENDYGAGSQLAYLLGAGYASPKAGKLLGNILGKQNFNSLKMPTQKTIDTSNELIRKELQNLGGGKLDYGDLNINKYIGEGTESMKQAAKNPLKEVSKKYDIALDQYELFPEVQKELRDSLQYTDLSVPNQKGGNVNIKKFLTPKGNFGEKELIEHSAAGSKKTGKKIIDQNILNNEDIEYISPRELKELMSDMKKVYHNGNKHYKLRQDIERVENVISETSDNYMKQLDSQYKQGLQKANPINAINEPIQQNNITVKELIDNFLKRGMTDPQKVKYHEPLVKSGFDKDVLKKASETVPSSKDFVSKFDSEIARSVSNEVIDPKYLKNFGVLGGNSVPKFHKMQKAYKYLDKYAEQAKKIHDSSLIGLDNNKIANMIKYNVFGSDMTKNVKNILKTGEQRTGTQKIGGGLKDMFMNYVKGSNKWALRGKAVADSAQTAIDPHRYGDEEYVQNFRRIYKNMNDD